LPFAYDSVRGRRIARIATEGGVSAYGLHQPLDRAARAAAKLALGRIARRWAPRREDLPTTWGLATDTSGTLSLHGTVLRDVLERWGSPLHVVDASRLAENAARFLAPPAGSVRRCDVHCSYKTNPIPGVLRILHATGIGAEVVSAYELWLALTLGVDPRAIVYNGPARSEDSIELALTREIGLININSRREVAPLAALARRLGKKPVVGIRVVVPGAAGGQFGERIDTGAALDTFREALRFPELTVKAIHSHYNGEIASRGQLDRFLSALLSFSAELRTRLGLEIEILDVGGNLACPTVSRLSHRTRKLAETFGCEPTPRPPESVLSIDGYVEHLVRRVEEHFASRGHPAPRIVVEPGRALLGNAQMDSGAYFVAFSSCFSHPRPGVVALRHGEQEVLRRAERFDDLIALDGESERALAQARTSRLAGGREAARTS
jgi:diaminopimelate decarboxylase